MKIIQKARILELKIQVNRENKKKIKEQGYRIFLQNPPRPLPSLHALKKVRSIFIIVAILMIALPGLQIIFAYDSMYRISETFYERSAMSGKENYNLEDYGWGFVRSIPIISGVLFLIFGGFTMAVDWTIYRRWGKHTIIKW